MYVYVCVRAVCTVCDFFVCKSELTTYEENKTTSRLQTTRLVAVSWLCTLESRVGLSIRITDNVYF